MAMNPNDQAKTLWIGDIESWMDENYVANLFTGVIYFTLIYRLHLYSK